MATTKTKPTKGEEAGYLLGGLCLVALVVIIGLVAHAPVLVGLGVIVLVGVLLRAVVKLLSP